jgi:hypothetical protein
MEDFDDSLENSFVPRPPSPALIKSSASSPAASASSMEKISSASVASLSSTLSDLVQKKPLAAWVSHQLSPVSTASVAPTAIVSPPSPRSAKKLTIPDSLEDLERSIDNP